MGNQVAFQGSAGERRKGGRGNRGKPASVQFEHREIIADALEDEIGIVEKSRGDTPRPGNA